MVIEMLTKKEYELVTKHLKPVSVSTTSMSWSETYFINGQLIRFSSVVGSEWVEESDMFCEEHIER